MCIGKDLERFEPQKLGFVEKDWGRGGLGGVETWELLASWSIVEKSAKMVEKQNTMVCHCCSDQVHPQPCTDFWNALLLGLSLFTV